MGKAADMSRSDASTRPDEVAPKSDSATTSTARTRRALDFGSQHVPEPRYPLFAKLLLWFLLISLLPLTLFSYEAYRDMEDTWRGELDARLATVASSTAERIEAYSHQHRQVATLLASSASVREGFLQMGTAPHTRERILDELARTRALREALNYYIDHAGYTNLLLVDLEGNVRFSMLPDPCQNLNLHIQRCRSSQLASVFEHARTMLATEMSDFALDPYRGSPSAYVAAPVLHAGRLLGVVALHLDNSALLEIVADETGLGETGEVVVGARDGERVLFVTPVRHDAAAGFRRSVDANAEPMDVLIDAVGGVQRVGTMRDYRGVETVAVGRYLPSLRWGMVVKQDVAEAAAAMRRHRDLSLLAGVLTALGVLGLAFAVARSISRPIVRLTGAVRRLAAGDLEQTLPQDSHDEIGVLDQAFNTMTAQLRDLYVTIEDKVAERTAQLAEANLALRHARDAAERASRAKSTFLTNMSHELRTPLNAILGYTELLREEAVEQGESARFSDLDNIHQAGVHLLGLVEELLDLARIEAGKVTLIEVEVELSAVVKRSLQTVAPVVEKNGNRMELDLASDLGRARLDEGKTRQILINLLGNAAKFTENGVITVRGRRRAADDDGPDIISLAVIDTGAGIVAERLEKIFEPFETGDTSSTREFGGMGLGLSLSRKLAEHMGGHLVATSELGEGSVFTLELPAVMQRR